MKRIRPNVVDIVVTYNNEGNEVILSEMNPEVTNLFFGLVSHYRRNKEKVFSISYEYLLSLCGSTDKKEARVIDKLMTNYFKEGLNNLAQTIYNEKSKVRKKVFSPAFNRVEVDNDEEIVTFEFADNEVINFFLAEGKDKFTKFNLSEFMLLQSVYSKTLFRILAQFQSTGKVKIEYNKLKSLFNKSDLSTSRFNNEVIKAAVEEINNNNTMIRNLTYSFLKKKRSISMVVFSFDKCKYNDSLNKDRKLSLYERQVYECAKELSELIDGDLRYIVGTLFEMEPLEFEIKASEGDVILTGNLVHCLLLQHDGYDYTNKIKLLKSENK